MNTLALTYPSSGTFRSMIPPRETTNVVASPLNFVLLRLGKAPTSNSYPELVKQSTTSSTPVLVVDAAPAVPTIPEAVMELRRISGLTWDEMAGLFGVTRRAIHHWANGSSLKPEHLRQVHAVLVILRRVARKSAEETRANLLAPLRDGRTPLQLLQSGEFDTVVALLGAKEQPSLSQSARGGTLADQPHATVFLSGLQDRPIKRGGSSRVAKTLRVSRPTGSQ